MVNLDLLIEDYVGKMAKDYKILGAMLTGSYLTGNMKENSDIDIFFIWEIDGESIRGREFYKSVEFEYFISPEWKYYDMLKNDLTSQEIYSKGKIIFDTANIFNNIKLKARELLDSYKPTLSLSDKTDYSFYVETIMKDGIDMLGTGELENFKFLSGIHIPRFCDIIAKLNKKYPIYEKYAIEELKLLDEHLLKLLVCLYQSKSIEEASKNWISLCKYVLKRLGDIDIVNYQLISKI